MKKPSASKRSTAKSPRGGRGGKIKAGGTNEATSDEFEREDMGIAPKE
jgi:hypothetical protein